MSEFLVDFTTVNNVQYERVLLVKLTENSLISNIVYSNKVRSHRTLFTVLNVVYPIDITHGMETGTQEQKIKI
jgi:hypothetical protein